VSTTRTISNPKGRESTASREALDQPPVQATTESDSAGAQADELRAVLESTPGAEDYKKLLGDKLGQKLFDALMKHVSMEYLAGEGRKALEKGAISIAGLEDSIGMDDESNKALVTFGDEVLGWAAERSLEWLEGPKGQAFINDVRDWVAENPEWILTLGILAGAGYAIHTLESGELGTSIGLAKGLEAKIKAKYGSISDFALQSVETGITYSSGHFKVEATATHDTDAGTSGRVEARYGTDEAHVGGHVATDADGAVSGGASAHYEGDGVSADASATHGESGTEGRVALTLGEGHRALSGEVTLDDAGAIESELSGRYGTDLRGIRGLARHSEGDTVFDLGTYHMIDAGGLTGSLETGGSGLDLSLGGGSGAFTGSGSVSADWDGKVDSLSAELGYTPNELLKLIAKLGYTEDGGTTGGLSAEYSSGDFSASASVEGNLTSGEISRIQAEFGFIDPDEFRRFTISFAHSAAEGGSIGARFETTIGQYKMRAMGGVDYSSSGLTGATGSLHLAKPMGDGMALIGGVKIDYDALSGDTKVMPGVGVQLFGAPLMLHTDFKDEIGFSIGIKF